jgi:hypothetical protein
MYLQRYQPMCLLLYRPQRQHQYQRHHPLHRQRQRHRHRLLTHRNPRPNQHSHHLLRSRLRAASPVTRGAITSVLISIVSRHFGAPMIQETGLSMNALTVPTVNQEANAATVHIMAGSGGRYIVISRERIYVATHGNYDEKAFHNHTHYHNHRSCRLW